VDTLVQHGIEKVFMVAGGGAMYLNNAVGAQPSLDVICVLHEQAAAIAAEAYAKVAGKLARCLVTAGLGGKYAATGVVESWLDSTPMIVISGQVKRADLVGTFQVRQRGVHELDLSAIVKSITKCAAIVTGLAHIRHNLERALYFAITGRSSPVWIEVLLDVQSTLVDPDGITGFNP
jgi:acetolactate synthase-1/2/3 large subunit